MIPAARRPDESRRAYRERFSLSIGGGAALLAFLFLAGALLCQLLGRCAS